MTNKYDFEVDNKLVSVIIPFSLGITSRWEKIRALTFWSKEPETLYWIGSFEDDAIFWDIGANIGIYSLFCAYCNFFSTTYAFEPQATNFLSLIANIHNNGYGARIKPQFMAVSDKSGEQRFYVKDKETGSSGGQLERGDNDACDYFVPVTTGNIFSDLYGCPNHIKIDVDGNELEILHGMTDVLNDGNLKGLLVEANNPDVVGFLETHGFVPDFHFNCLRGAGWKRASNTNIIFRRV